MSYLPKILFDYTELQNHREAIIDSEYKIYRGKMLSEAWEKLRDIVNRPQKYNIQEFAGQKLCLLASPDLTAQSKAMQTILTDLGVDYALFD